MLNSERTRTRKKDPKWEPSREDYQRMAIKYDNMLNYCKRFADDPTGILSTLYHDIVEKYCNLRGELRELRRANAELRRNNALLKEIVAKQYNLGESEKL